MSGTLPRPGYPRSQHGPAIRRVHSQKGITLLEIVIALALIGIVSLAASVTYQQVILFTAVSNDENRAVNQVVNAQHWIARDVAGANPASINDTPAAPAFFSLTRREWGSGSFDSHTIEYLLQPGASADLKELWREYDGTQRTFVAENIKAREDGVTDCEWDATREVLIVVVTAQVGRQTETRRFEAEVVPDAT